MAELVNVRHVGQVAVVTIDSPPINALSTRVLDMLAVTFAALVVDPAIRAVVIRGEGERAFMAGADITEFPQDDGPSATSRSRKFHDTMDSVARCLKPVVAAIHGFCLGGGLELALACDVRVVAEDARLGLPEIKLGLLPGGGGTQRLPRLIGSGRARLMCLVGEPVTAQQAYEWGLVEQVVPPGEVLPAALSLAQKLASQSPHAVTVIKGLMQETEDLPLAEGLQMEAAAFGRCVISADGREGVRAFLDKRTPNWLGR